FNHFAAWKAKKSTVITPENTTEYGCPGAGYWLSGVQRMPRDAVIGYLFGQEGLKASADTMARWMEAHPPYTPEHQAVVIAPMDTPAAGDHIHRLKTVTFFIRPDQLALLITGAEHRNGSSHVFPVSAIYGSGCGQMLSHFDTFDAPKALLGGTDIAVRKHLPPDLLAFTVTRSMLEQLLNLDEACFLHKTFWTDLKAHRAA
ncbi:MAG TPA: hypothetical protein DHV36_00835, partial [Desulfobacteraceae bacterium]|nr:hypothetical protein [Desulfobacteraceae bacterium]